MEDRLTQSIEDIKSFVNRSIITILSLYLVGIISFLNSKYFGDDTPIRFLDVRVYPEYISFLFGILYCAFALVMYFKFHQLSYLIDRAREDEKDDLFDTLKYYHWISSPFHRSKSGLLTFLTIICLMYLHLLWLCIAHLFFTPARLSIPARLYRQIGIFDAIFFLVSMILVFFLLRKVGSIREKLGL
jgi:hypothetical protein